MSNLLDIMNKSRQTKAARGEVPPPAARPAPARKTWLDYAFLLLVGGIYMYALNRTIISSTHLWMAPLSLYAVGLMAMLIFMVALHNKATRLATLGIIVAAALFVLFTLEDAAYQYAHFYELYLMVTGHLAYRADLGLTAIWLISLLLAVNVVVFMFHRFNFYILAAGGGAVLLFTWVPGFTRDETAFFFFLVSFCLILVRKMNKSTAMVLVAAPLCALLVWGVNVFLPAESEFYVRRPLRQAVDGPMAAVGDFLYELFNPTHFTFQSTGFAGAGGRLGGPVSPNNRSVMTVHAPGRTYLAGATSNTYTGFSWISTLSHDDINHHGLPPGHFEMLETAAALMRGATHRSGRASVALAALELTAADQRLLQARDFPVIGVSSPGHPEDFYLHTYMPLEVMTVAIGTNRTGTIFRPGRLARLWFYAGGPDYLDAASVSPTGDIRTPGFMSRGATYHMQFLNVNPRLSFVEELLRQTGPGVYAARGTERVQVAGLSMGRSQTGDLSLVGHSPTNNFARLSYPPANNFERAGHAGGGIPAARIPGLAPEDVSAAAGSDEIIITIEGDGGDISVTAGGVRGSISAVIETARATRDVITLPGDNFGVGEMAGLFDFFAHAGAGRGIHYIPGEAELLGWLDVFSAQVLAGYAQEVRRHFLEVPEIVPQRVRDLTADIVRGRASDFDRVMAIREFLLQFPYTLSPVPVPRGVCFVDHFLFEGQEGYCTYFASAMAVMARIAGVPSRYVEGFVLPPAADRQQAVTVTNRMAHAWVEVYLEGFGWHIVEATPTYAFLMDPEVIIPPGGGIGPDFDNPEWLEMLMADWEMEDGHGWEVLFAGRPVTPGAAEDTGGIAITLRHVRWFFIALLSLAAAGLILFLAARRLHLHYKLRRVKSLPPNRQAQIYFKGILDIITYYTKPMTTAETPKAYGGRMGKRFAFQSDSVFFRDLIALYYKAKYSSRQITGAELALMEEAYHDMLHLLRTMRRRPKYIYLRYVRRVGVI